MDGIIIISVVVLFLVLIFHALSHPTYKCPACDFETWSEDEAAGHQARHSQHKPVRE